MYPNFKIDDTVQCPSTLYKETQGKITKVEKVFKKVDENGKFIYGGLEVDESTIPLTSLPYTFKDDVLKIDYPEETMTFLFYGYAYVVSTPKMNTLFPERVLEKV